MWEESKRPLLASNDKVNGEKDDSTKQQRRGLEQSRSCNDLVFLILFLGCCAGFVLISIVAFAKGDPKLLIPNNEWIARGRPEAQLQGWFTSAVAQAKIDSDVLAGVVALAVVLGFAWIQLMKKFTKEFIYGTFVAGVAAIVGLGGYLVRMGRQPGNDSSISTIGYVAFGLAALLVLAILILRKKVALTCAMFTETCRGVQHNVALLPVLVVVVSAFIGFAAFWVCSFIYLWSVPDKSVNVSPNGVPQFNESIRNLMLFQVFAFFWISCFLSAVYQHVVAGSISDWYFSRDMVSQRAHGPAAFRSLFRAVTTSFGSLAFGSLVLAFVMFLNFLLRITQKSNYKNKVIVYIVSCLSCMLSCIEGIVRYINKFAYIYVAMHGYSFLTAARECFDLISRNLFSAVIMDTIAGFVLFVGKMLFTAVCALVTVGALDGLHREITYVTLTLAVVLSYVVLHIISLVIGAGVDTVFVCYLEDLELNKGGNMYISPDLHALLQESASKHKATVSDV